MVVFSVIDDIALFEKQIEQNLPQGAMRFPGRPVFLAAYTAAGAIRLNPGGDCDRLPLAVAQAQMATGLFAFCGIAEPGAFFQSLASS